MHERDSESTRCLGRDLKNSPLPARTGKETHRKLIDEVGLVCFALSDIAQSIGGGAIPCSPEIMGVSNLVSEALWSHAHRLKPKAGEALKTARALILQLVVSLPSAPLVGADDKVAALHASPLGSAAVHDGDRAAERRLETESEGHEIDEVLRHDMEILRRTKKVAFSSTQTTPLAQVSILLETLLLEKDTDTVSCSTAPGLMSRMRP